MLCIHRAAVTAVILAAAPFLLRSQTISTVAGGGQPNNVAATAAPVGEPCGVTGDAAGNLYIADNQHTQIYKINPAGQLTTIAGNGTYFVGPYSSDGSPALLAGLPISENSCGFAVDSAGDIFLPDYSDSIVIEIVAATGKTKTVAGTLGNAGFSGDGGPAAAALLSHPSAVAVDASGDLFIADQWNNRVREIVAATGNIETVAGNGTSGLSQ